MRTNSLFTRLVGAVLVLLLSGALETTSALNGQQQAPPQQEPVAQSPSAGTPAQPSSPALPDSPGAARMQSSPLQQPAPGQGAPTPSVQQPSQPVTKPAGTAAAEMTNSGGVTASEPAGVAIAPAKQRRTRSFLIKLGAILGAGAAVGTVAALSRASGSKPPGAQ